MSATQQLAQTPATRRTVAEFLSRLPQATWACEIAAISDQLGQARDDCAVAPLLARLCDGSVQAQPDLADCVCSALVALDVMCPCGECSFAFRPRHLLAPQVVEMINDLGSAVPMRYLIARQA